MIIGQTCDAPFGREVNRNQTRQPHWVSDYRGVYKVVAQSSRRIRKVILLRLNANVRLSLVVRAKQSSDNLKTRSM
jgi:hypothetical protein